MIRKTRKQTFSICSYGKTLFGICLIIFNVGATIMFTQTVFAVGQGNLVGYWKLDESSTGSTVLDSSGNNNNLSVIGSPQPSNNTPLMVFPDSHSLTFNGSTDTVQMASPIGFNFGTSPRSISSWIYPTSAPTSGNVEVPVAYGACAYNSNPNNVGKAFGYFIDSSMDVHFWGCGGYDFSTNSSIQLNQWSNIVISYNGTTVTVYINGTAVASQADTLVSQGTSTPEMDIGSADLIDVSPHFFAGNIDDVRIYSRALSSTEAFELAGGNNITDVWSGSASSNWYNGANWSNNSVPDGYTNVTIPGSTTYEPTLTANTQVANLTIQSGGSLDLSGYNLTLNDSGTFTNYGTLNLEGSEILTNFTNDTNDGGTVVYDGSGSYTSLSAGDNYANLIFQNGGNWTINAPLSTIGSLTIGSSTSLLQGSVYPFTIDKNFSNMGTFYNPADLSVSGNFSNVSTFTADGSTVNLNGSNQTVSGNTTFYNLTKSASSADTLTFEAGSTQTIANVLTLSGLSSSQLLSLKSSSPGTQWRINPQGATSLGYLDVKDSDNLSSGYLIPSNSTDAGNNVRWDFNPPNTPSSLGPSGYVSGGYINSLHPSLSFTLSDPDASSTVKYEIQISENSNFSSPLVDYTSGTQTNGQSTGFMIGQAAGSGSYSAGGFNQSLSDATAYYWRVKAIDDGGLSSAYATANSGAVAFKTDTTPPTVPGKPQTTSPTYSSSPLWTWAASSDSGSGLAATPYVVEWSQDPSFVSGVSSTTSSTNSLILPVSLTSGTWYVRVNAKDIVGNISSYSTVGSVAINLPAPSSTKNNTAPPTQSDSSTSATSNVTTQTTVTASGSAINTQSKIASSDHSILLNNYAQYNSGTGKQLNLTPNQIVYFKVNSQTHSVTVNQVGGDFAVLTLRSTPREVTIQTGDTDEYDVNGDGKPDIKISLLGTRNGVALLSFAQVKQPTVIVNLASSSNHSANYFWLINLIGIAIGMWVVWRWHQRSKDKTPAA